jgi:tetratricopeptide (TPR) repeat protein
MSNDETLALVRLEIVPFAALLARIIPERLTGALLVAHPQGRRVLHWVRGELVMIEAGTAEESLAAFLQAEGLLDLEIRRALDEGPPVEIVERFDRLAGSEFDSTRRQQILRDWVRASTRSLFSLDSGTAAFQSGDALDPARRIFIGPMAAWILNGVRSISSGLVLRNALGDLERLIVLREEPLVPLEQIPLDENESRLLEKLTASQKVGAFVRGAGTDSTIAARLVIALSALGTVGPPDEERIRPKELPQSHGQIEQDMAIMAAIGSNDQRSIQALSLARRLERTSLEEILGMSLKTGGAQVDLRLTQMLREYDPATFPPMMREPVQQIRDYLERARKTIASPASRAAAAGDNLIGDVMQRGAQMDIARVNLRRAKELTIKGDFYGAIVLLKEVVRFNPESAEAWHLLASCQERNPQWRRDAATNYLKALAVDPIYVEAMISLGNLYRAEGLASRAVHFFEEALTIQPDHPIAIKRLSELGVKVKR